MHGSADRAPKLNLKKCRQGVDIGSGNGYIATPLDQRSGRIRKKRETVKAGERGNLKKDSSGVDKRVGV
jgi:hypothetical protein